MDYIAHHGIRGQKWGQRNGPPYPLKPGAHSAAEKRAASGTTYGSIFRKKTIIKYLQPQKTILILTAEILETTGGMRVTTLVVG